MDNNISKYSADIEFIYQFINQLRNTIIDNNKTDLIKQQKDEYSTPNVCGYITTYKKANGSIFEKHTKHQPIRFDKAQRIGNENSYGDKIISICSDSHFTF